MQERVAKFLNFVAPLKIFLVAGILVWIIPTGRQTNNFVPIAILGLLLLLLEIFALSQRTVKSTKAANYRETEHHNASTNDSMRQENLFLEEIIDSMSDMLLVFDQDGKVHRVSKTTISSYGSASIMHKNVHEFILNAKGESDPDLTNLIKIGPLFIQAFEAGFKTESGRVVPVLLFMSRIASIGAQRKLIVCFMKDISDVKKATKDRDQMQSQLVQASKLAALGTLGASMAHELNNPLVGIKGFAQVIAQDHAATVGIRAQSKRIIHAAGRMQKIINHLRVFTRQSRENDWQALNINKPIQDSLILMDQQLQQSNVSVKLDLTPDLPAVIGDLVQLESVFQNLISNSRDAFASLVDSRVRMINFSTRLSNGQVDVIYSDNAAGIPDHVLGRIFDPFFTTKEVGVGTGLGLSIVQSIMAKHKATIKIQSKVGEGTSFFMSFPVDLTATIPLESEAEPNLEQVELERPAQPRSAILPFSLTHKNRLLIVDDDRDVSDVLAIFLENCMDATIVTTVAEAVAALATTKFDYVITDLNLTDGSGADVIQITRQTLPNCRIIIATGLGSNDKRVIEGMRLGAHDVLEKPFSDSQSVIEVVANLRARAA